MGYHHRNLLSDSDSDCEICCHSEVKCPSPPYEDCIKACLREGCHPKHSNISSYLIIGFSIAAAVFILLSIYAIYIKFFSHRRISNRLTRTRDSLTQHSFIDQEHGPTVDHPVWYIRTIGLQQSIIDSITVCKYNKNDGLIDGTDCSVCLSEFEENEDLRLLPKCNHAFHLPCIDTWLRSHTNCPMCRAPIVTDPLRVRVPSMNPNNSVLGTSNSTAFESERMELEDGVVNGEEEERRDIEEDGSRVCEGEGSGLNMMQQPRRSVSLDSSSAANINFALSAVVSSVEPHHGNDDEQIVSKRVDGNSSMKRSRSFNGKHLLSWYSRSQKKSNVPVRSF